MNSNSTMTLEILKAVQFGVRAHGKQQRKTGGPYITHPIDAAMILLGEGDITDVATLQAAVLHDVVEDTPVGLDKIEAAFGAHVASIVDEVSDDKSLVASERKRAQIDHMPHVSPQAQLVKLADKISNLRGLIHAVPPGWTLLRAQGYALWCQVAMRSAAGINAQLEEALRATLASEITVGTEKHPMLPAAVDEAEFLREYYELVDGSRKKKPVAVETSEK